ncbi:SDR family oxidoreductase [Allorhodopirellula heiligendammensis]|uniref:Enoyl-[acyl-carrier-protein] reductase [NADPH] FabL n=1 Tax=Allorhodopirellula heiligendammensis TaxID=2714739 RepID=A0A5C6C3A4_9BACT|nr:SDR family oxidoreductase [Allorhodopirellula heiligendammensis]TWU18983.1 Enoyl-[acyl-carrier-protein] reductase [NADPH] FabL [Allorhodopirellula heiligendammensis]
MNQDLMGKRALVTGASRGIGREIALELAARGASVAVNFLNSQEQAVDVARQIANTLRPDADVMLVKADVSQRGDIQSMVDEVQSRFGGLDIIVSNAAAGGFRALSDLTPVNFEAVLRTNASPVIWLTQAASTLLGSGSDNGKVVAVSSHGSRWSVPHYGAIGASKAALESLIRHLALELGDRGINFNCVLPGIIATDAIASMPDADNLVKAASERMMLGERTLTQHDVAKVVAFLCSPDSDLIQAQTIVVDGGVSIRV